MLIISHPALTGKCSYSGSSSAAETDGDSYVDFASTVPYNPDGITRLERGG